MVTGKVIVGVTGAKIERMSLGIALAVIMFMPMAYLMGVDTGVVFCRHEDWETVGGYNEEQLVSEDVRFLLC